MWPLRGLGGWAPWAAGLEGQGPPRPGQRRRLEGTSCRRRSQGRGVDSEAMSRRRRSGTGRQESTGAPGPSELPGMPGAGVRVRKHRGEAGGRGGLAPNLRQWLHGRRLLEHGEGDPRDAQQENCVFTSPPWQRGGARAWTRRRDCRWGERPGSELAAAGLGTRCRACTGQGESHPCRPTF